MEHTQTYSQTLHFSDVARTLLTHATVLVWKNPTANTILNSVPSVQGCLYLNNADQQPHRSARAARLVFNMATPHFEPLQGNEDVLSVIDLCMKSWADKSEQRIDLIPGGKYSRRLSCVSALLYCDIYCHTAHS
jgi:hypothetical protein